MTIIALLILVLMLMLMLVLMWVLPTFMRSLFLTHAFKLSSAHLLNKVINMSRIIGLLSKYVCTSGDLLQKGISLLALTSLYAFLNDIVAIPIFHHLVERTVHCLGGCLLRWIVVLILIVILHDFINDLFLVLVTSILHALLNNIAGKLMITQRNYITFHLSYDLVLIFLNLPMF